MSQNVLHNVLQGASLSDLMNAMISRLEYSHPEEMLSVPVSKQWDMIHIYVSVDPVLATLYKQYCEAKENLGKLLLTKDVQDPMTEIAWDMHDSLRSAIETRLLELKEDRAISARVAAIKATKFAPRSPIRPVRKQSPSLNEMMTFMLWAGMMMKENPTQYDIRRDFSRAS